VAEKELVLCWTASATGGPTGRTIFPTIGARPAPAGGDFARKTQGRCPELDRTFSALPGWEDGSSSRPAHGDWARRKNMSAYFLLDPATGRLRFTATDRQALGPRFARAGIHLETLKTLAQARAAAAEVSHQEMQALAAELKGRDPALDAVMAALPE